jgi:Maltokinase N-terminal cap domain
VCPAAILKTSPSPCGLDRGYRAGAPRVPPLRSSPVAVLHRATLAPTKAEVLAGWLPAQPWAPPGEGEVALVGAYRFDDPEGRVGLEVHLVRWGGTLLQVPLTYREAPLDGADDHLAGTMEHSVLGTRWVTDGLRDPVFIRMLAAAAMTGCGQAVGLVENDGRWILVPTPVQLVGGGWSDERVAVDGFVVEADDGDGAVLRNDRFDLLVSRRPVAGAQPTVGLTATWPGQGQPVVLAEVHDRNRR